MVKVSTHSVSIGSYSETYLLRTSKRTQNQNLLSEVLIIRVGLCTQRMQGQNEGTVNSC